MKKNSSTPPKKIEKAAAPKAAKAPAKASKKKTKGVRYTAKQKSDIVDFVNEVNTSKGRGGVAAATRKFKVSPITINNWIKSSGKPAKATKAKKAGKAAKAAKAPKASKSSAGSSSVTATLNKMAKISAKIESLQAEFDSLKQSL